jgi:hypothetical protein
LPPSFRAVEGKGRAADLLTEIANEVADFLPPEDNSARGLLDRASRFQAKGQVTAAERI